jgi:hypothetical protein
MTRLRGVPGRSERDRHGVGVRLSEMLRWYMGCRDSVVPPQLTLSPTMPATQCHSLTQGSTLRTVCLPRTTKSGCRASRFPCKLARQTTKYFVGFFVDRLTHWTSENFFWTTSFNLILAQRTSGSKS